MSAHNSHNKKSSLTLAVPTRLRSLLTLTSSVEGVGMCLDPIEDRVPGREVLSESMRSPAARMKAHHPNANNLQHWPVAWPHPLKQVGHG